MEPISSPCSDIATGYFLVDICNLSELDCDTIKMVPCVPQDLTNAQELMPCLIALDEISHMQREQLLEILESQRMGQHAPAVCAWFDCKLSIDELALHIAGFLTGRGGGGRPVFWRYFDPRVFATSMAILSQTQKDALLGPIECWKFVWRGHWWQVVQTASHIDPLSLFSAGWPVDEQWPRLLQSRVLDRILDLLDEHRILVPEECLAYQTIALEYLADQTVTSYLNEDDQAEFGYLCARYGKAYRQHEKLRGSWEALRRGEISWTDLRFVLDKLDLSRLDALLHLKKGVTKWR